MKTEDFRLKLIWEKYLRHWTSNPVKWNNDGSVTILDGGYGISVPLYFKLKNLPFKFDKIYGNADFSGVGLENLKNFPNYVRNTLYVDKTEIITRKNVCKICKVDGSLIVY